MRRRSRTVRGSRSTWRGGLCAACACLVSFPIVTSLLPRCLAVLDQSSLPCSPSSTLPYVASLGSCPLPLPFPSSQVIRPLTEETDEFGTVVLATVKTYGDTVHTFVQRGGYKVRCTHNEMMCMHAVWTSMRMCGYIADVSLLCFLRSHLLCSMLCLFRAHSCQVSAQ
jgi:hypothetical protein